MITLALIFMGLCFGSFANALAWRIYSTNTEQLKKKPNAEYINRLSILSGRSMCPHCRHVLGVLDLIPIISWVFLKGKCRYCREAISRQYPIVELVTALLFSLSYIYWPVDINGAQIAIFIFWLLLLVGFMALIIYDLRWLVLPNRIIYPLTIVALAQAFASVIASNNRASSFRDILLAVAISGGIFYILFQLSSGKWIGGGDVKLGWLLGISIGIPSQSLLMLFLASVLGCLVSIPLLATKRLKRSSTIPFGPFLIGATVIVRLFGPNIINWYQQTFIRF